MQCARLLRLIVVGAALLLIAAIWVAVLSVIERSREGALEAASATLDRVGRAVEVSINRNLVQTDALLAGLPMLLNTYLTPEQTNHAGIAQVLRELNNQNFFFRDLLLIGPDGLPVSSALTVSRRRTLPLDWRGAFAEATPGGGVLLAGPVRNPVTQEWSVYLGRQIRLARLGPVLAVAEVQVSALGVVLGVGGETEGQRITLERADGTLLASLPHDEFRMGQRISPPASELLAADGDRVVLARSATDGVEVLRLVRSTIYPALFISASLRTDAVLAAWRTDRERLLWGAGALTVLIAALSAALLLWLRSREAAEAERQRWRATLESAIESMSDGFVMFDAEDRLVACNTRYKDFYRISAPFIVPGARFEDILREGAKRGQYPQAGPDIEAFVREMTAWHRGDNPPIERLLPDGRWVLITERRTPDGGTVGIRTDITAMKRAMEELAEARDQAKAAAEAKSAFLSRMSHELRTPLNSILGFAQLLAADGSLSEAQRAQVQTLLGAGRHLLELVNGLLDLSKIEAGRLELAVRTVALPQLLDSCAELLRPEAERKGIALRVSLSEDLPAHVRADPTRVRQLVLNLLANAVKFTPPGGVVALRGMSLAETDPEGRRLVRLEVEDTGPGIAKEQQGRLFQDFQQIAPSLEPGTGLGLAISARLVEAMGGRIGCESEPGRGAQFWVELPLPVESPPEAEAAAAEQPAPQRRLRVLVVDDVAANRLVARAMLAAAGHEVELAADGAEAVAAVEAGHYDVVLMDLQMPTMDGLEATRRIRALPPPQGSVPVVALTASALPEQIEACRAAGMDGHLSKPIEKGALLALLAKIAPSDEATPAEPSLMPSALERLAKEAGSIAPAVVAGFLAELRLARQLLTLATSEGVLPASLAQTAHRLASGGRTMGADRLAAAAERLAAALDHGGPTGQPLAAALAAVESTVPLLEAWLAERQASVKDEAA
ncbi:MAG: PAS-domain containing protein [Acetobacteraceae bacterium]|nr:PAS-domain containing protein [Acetobacteraceae bacterium]